MIARQRKTGRGSCNNDFAIALDRHAVALNVTANGRGHFAGPAKGEIEIARGGAGEVAEYRERGANEDGEEMGVVGHNPIL